MIAIGLSRKHALDADPKAIQQINFTGNLDRDGNTAMFFFIGKGKELFKTFQKEPWEYCIFILF